MEIYVNNLAAGTQEEQLKDLFAAFGEVAAIRINANSFTKLHKGNAFVSMRNRNEGTQAIEALNGTSFNGRKIVVNEARARI